MDSYEKKYKESLERAKEQLNGAKVFDYDNEQIAHDIRTTVYNIFPEIKESEDEKIRKVLINMFKGYDIQKVGDFTDKEIIAWLEKQKTSEESLQYVRENHSPSEMSDFQAAMNIAVAKAYDKGYNDGLEKHGEQKPFDYENANIQQKDFAPKVEPKFHEGEWLCENEPNNYARFIQILETVNVQGKERYRISRNIHNDEDIVEFDFVEKYYHKFDIKDAKDGDVLYSPCLKLLWIFNSRNTVYCGCNLNYNDGAFCGEGYFERPTDAIPATKEQRDLLFQKMKKAGYEWDAEKKELKKIEQKPAWSEEDEKIVGNIRSIIEKYAFSQSAVDVNGELCEKEYIEADSWLKSLKDRVGCEVNCTTTSEPVVRENKGNYGGISPNSEWGEEDEEKFRDVIRLIEQGAPVQSMRDHYNNWLRTLKDRVQPQNTWKPSDRQMASITCAVRKMKESACYDSELVSLYQDLKKLREE